MLYRQCLTQLSATAPNVSCMYLGAPGGQRPALNWPLCPSPSTSHRESTCTCQLAECRPAPLLTSEALRILSGRPTLPLPQNSGSANSVPYTKPSRISPVPVRSLGSGTETRVVLQSGSLPGDNSPHVGGPLQSPWSPSLQIKCTFYRGMKETPSSPPISAHAGHIIIISSVTCVAWKAC